MFAPLAAELSTKLTGDAGSASEWPVIVVLILVAIAVLGLVKYLLSRR